MIKRVKRYLLSRYGRNFLTLKYLRVRTSMVIRKRAKDIEGYVEDFVSDLDQNSSRTICVCYNNAFSPPTFGDFLGVLMLARFLALSGYRLSFAVIDLTREVHWSFLEPSEQESFISQQIDLAKYILPKGTRIELINSLTLGDQGQSENSEIVIGGVLLPKGEEFYRVAPHFLHVLIVKHKWMIPLDFLLRGSKRNDELPYIAWHIRRGLWDTRRNSTDEAIQRDFYELRKCFPLHSIMIFSDPLGLQAVFSILTGRREVKEYVHDGVKIAPQPEPGFIAAIPLVLSADFYYQRGGGGLGMISIFSSVPYLQVCPDSTNFLGKHRDKLAPWASTQQVFRQVWGPVERFSIDKMLLRLRDFV